MTKFQQVILATGFTGFIAAAPVANAAPIVPNPDVVDPAADVLVTVGVTGTGVNCPAGFTCGSGFISYVHDITNNGFTVGDTVNSASLQVFLKDNGGSEDLYFTIGLTQLFSDTNNIGSTFIENIGALISASVTDLQADGKIGVKIEVVQQGGGNASDFIFDRSELSVDFANRGLTPTADIPEPATLALFGLGLTGLGFRRRKQA